MTTGIPNALAVLQRELHTVALGMDEEQRNDRIDTVLNAHILPLVEAAKDVERYFTEHGQDLPMSKDRSKFFSQRDPLAFRNRLRDALATLTGEKEKA